MKRIYTIITALFIWLINIGNTNAQVNISVGNTVTQDFTIGTSATATLPSGWKADKNTTVRLVGSYSSAVTATEQRAGNNMSSSATNGIYNYAAGDPTSATDRAVGGLSSSSASKSVNVYVQLTNNGASTINNFTISYDVEKYRKGSNAAGFSIQMYYSTDGTNWTSAGTDFLTSFAADADNSGYATAPGSTVSVSEKTLNQSLAASSSIYLAWNYSVTSGTTTSNAQALGIDNVSITANSGSTPLITVNPSSLTGFNYIQGSGPSSEQSFSISGANLTGNISITPPTNYEISTGTGGSFSATNPITLNQSGGTVDATTIYVRLKAGLSGGNYNDENITAASDGATNKTVTCSGYVEVPLTTTLPYSETFNSDLSGVYTYSVSGATKVWVHDGAGAASMNGYNSGDVEEDWLILPGINLNNYTNEVLTFQSWYQYGSDDADNYLKLFYSTDYTGLGNPTSATWTELLYTKPSTATTFTSSGNIELGAINGTSVYIGFKYRGILDGYRNWKIDNVSIEEADVVAPSSFTATAQSTSQVNLSWAQNSSSDNVLIVYDSDNSFTEPVDGETYTVSSSALGGTVIHNASATSFEHTGLDPNTTYYYKAWSVDGSDKYSEGVTANAKTPKNEPSNHVTNFTASQGTPTTSAINLSWTDASGGVIPDGYLIKGSSTSYAAIVDPVDGTAESDGALVKNVVHGSEGATSITGLTGNTTYYFKIFSYSNSGSSINYKTDGTVPQANATTANEPDYLVNFEGTGETKTAYASGNVTLSSISWNMTEALIGTSTSDWKNGARSARMQGYGTSSMTMLANKSDGIGNVSFSYRRYGTDVQVDWKVEYSTDNGNNWTQIGSDFTAPASDVVQVFSETVNKTGDIRIRIKRATETGTSNNRLNIDDITIDNYTIAAQVSQTVNTTGIVQFNSQPTALVMNIGSITGEGDITCQRHLNAPTSTGGIGESNISNYRWVIVKDAGITSIDTELRFYLKDIPNHGISEGAADIKLYKRSTPGSGNFELVGTLTYVDMGPGQDNDYLSLSNVTSFSEFVFASASNPLPVEFATLTATTSQGSVIISWQTATEVNNYGFEVERTPHNPPFGKGGTQGGWEKIGFVAGHGNSNSTKDYSFTDNNISTSGKYAYRLKQIDTDGSFSYSQVVETDVTVNLTYSLGQNYPNPFNPTTRISYTIPETGLVTLKVYNLIGETVAELVNQTQEAGKYEIEFNGGGLSNGVYFYELKANGFTSVKKLMLLK